MNHGDQRVFFNSNTYVMGLRQLYIVYSFSVWIYFTRLIIEQNEMNRALGHLCAHIG